MSIFNSLIQSTFIFLLQLFIDFLLQFIYVIRLWVLDIHTNIRDTKMSFLQPIKKTKWLSFRTKWICQTVDKFYVLVIWITWHDSKGKICSSKTCIKSLTTELARKYGRARTSSSLGRRANKKCRLATKYLGGTLASLRVASPYTRKNSVGCGTKHHLYRNVFTFFVSSYRLKILRKISVQFARYLSIKAVH